MDGLPGCLWPLPFRREGFARPVLDLGGAALIKQGLLVTACACAWGPAVPLHALTLFFLIIWLK